MRPPLTTTPAGRTPLVVAYGTAGLYGALSAGPSDAVLAAALETGFRRIDTAPSYGHGRTEGEVAARVRSRSRPPRVTTKVGLWPAPAPGRAKVAAGRLLARLPAPAERALRRARSGGTAGPGETAGPSGRFEVAAVRASVHNSLRLFGRVDRLLLHEVLPADITAELLTELARYKAAGDVTQLGVATQPAHTADAYDAGEGVFDVAQFDAGPYARAIAFGPGRRPAVLVGHGLLGPAGAALARLRRAAAADTDVAGRWHAASAGTSWEGPQGLARALLARAHGLDLDEVVIATSRLAALPEAASLATADPPPAEVSAACAELILSTS